MRLSVSGTLAAILITAACSGSLRTPATPTPANTISGVWTGVASDSSGSMMGSGSAGSMMGGTTWSITQSGNAFTGTMQVGGHEGGTMTVSGMMTGSSGSFTMTMSGGSMMSGNCSATATGTFDMDDMMTALHGTYEGMNTCTGPFTHGQMAMSRR